MYKINTSYNRKYIMDPVKYYGGFVIAVLREANWQFARTGYEFNPRLSPVKIEKVKNVRVERCGEFLCVLIEVNHAHKSMMTLSGAMEIAIGEAQKSKTWEYASRFSSLLFNNEEAEGKFLQQCAIVGGTSLLKKVCSRLNEDMLAQAAYRFSKQYDEPTAPHISDVFKVRDKLVTRFNR